MLPFQHQVMAHASDRLIALDRHIVVEQFGNDDGMAARDNRLGAGKAPVIRDPQWAPRRKF